MWLMNPVMWALMSQQIVHNTGKCRWLPECSFFPLCLFAWTCRWVSCATLLPFQLGQECCNCVVLGTTHVSLHTCLDWLKIVRGGVVSVPLTGGVGSKVALACFLRFRRASQWSDPWMFGCLFPPCCGSVCLVVWVHMTSLKQIRLPAPLFPWLCGGWQEEGRRQSNCLESQRKWTGPLNQDRSFGINPFLTSLRRHIPRSCRIIAFCRSKKIPASMQLAATFKAHFAVRVSKYRGNRNAKGYNATMDAKSPLAVAIKALSNLEGVMLTDLR